MNEEDAPAPTTLIDLLNELVEPPEPPPVAMTPETWGWAVLAALLALALAWLAWRAWRRWRANAYGRAALAELATAGDDPATIAEILRRTAFAAWPRERVASLTGRDWLAFLDSTGGGGFSDGPGAALVEAPYRDGDAPVPGLGEIAARWVRRHRVETPA
jgi:hypothetical protein